MNALVAGAPANSRLALSTNATENAAEPKTATGISAGEPSTTQLLGQSGRRSIVTVVSARAQGSRSDRVESGPRGASRIPPAAMRMNFMVLSPAILHELAGVTWPGDAQPSQTAGRRGCRSSASG